MTTAFVGLGSNIGNSVAEVQRAVTALVGAVDIHVLAASPCYRTKPMGSIKQEWFVNAVVQLVTSLSAESLLRVLQEIERDQERVRGERWGPRTIDCDLLLFGQQVIDTPLLTVPHPGLTTREFVLYPLADIAPDWVLPSGEVVSDLLAGLPRRGMERLQELDLCPPQ